MREAPHQLPLSTVGLKGHKGIRLAAEQVLSNIAAVGHVDTQERMA
jgi:hypothetical protein